MPPWSLSSPNIKCVLLLALLLLPLLAGTAHAQSVIDVAVFYTPQAKTHHGGTARIKTKIDELVVATNMAYADSGVSQTINLVAVEEVVGYTESLSTGSAFTSIDAMYVDLDRLQSQSDGYMDEVHTIRDRMWADAVILLRSRDGGLANFMGARSTKFASLAFGVSIADAGIFAHELGHLMGLRHDRHVECRHDTDNPLCPPNYPYAYGYVNQKAFAEGAATSKRWTTIMAYKTQCSQNDPRFDCERVLYFSNPSNSYPRNNGDPMGVAGTQITNAVDGPANAALRLNETRTTVAEFRQGRAVKVSFDAGSYAVTEGGTVTVTVQLDAAPGRTLDLPIPLTATSTDGAWPGDYTLPASITFGANQTSRTFTFSANQDTRQEDEETVILGFGAPLPAGVAVGSQATATVTLTDNDTVPAAPSVSTVALISNPGGGYAAGEEIAVAVVFTKPITVTGTPRIALTIGFLSYQMVYQADRSASEVLVFTYTVAANQRGPEGVTMLANRLSLPSGTTIKDTANQDAGLNHDAIEATSSHAVDGVAPRVFSPVVDGDTVTLACNEALDELSVPAASVLTVTADGTRVAVNSVVVSGRTVTMTLDSNVAHDQAVTLSYTPGTRPLRDVAGNLMAAFSGRAVTNNTPEPLYDTDADGLLEVATLAQLDAMGHDPNGDGIPTTAGATAYAAAFPNVTRVVCRTRNRECVGYELDADLDFDTDGDGQIDVDDEYWNSGAGWVPIGTNSNPFSATFEGNDHTIRNLFIDRRTNNVGLFGSIGPSGAIRFVGVVDVDVTGEHVVGGLVGRNDGTIINSYATGGVSGGIDVGGLVGQNNGTIQGSYATGRVSGGAGVGGLVGANKGPITASYATGRVSGTQSVGGLVGLNDGTIHTSYAAEYVSGKSLVGGLVGLNDATITNSYAAGGVSGGTDVGGLVGQNKGPITASYWDTDTSGRLTGNHGEGKTTTQLQTPTGYITGGIYADWNVDLDGDGNNDAPWDFGTASQYPALGADRWQEFGHQLRAGPDLTVVTISRGLVELSWSAVDTSPWTSPPAVTYTVYRRTGSTVAAVAEDLTARAYTDRTVRGGTTYVYQVAAVVDGGEGTRSAQLALTTTPNQKPAFDDGTSTTTRSVAENTATGVAIGLPVSATDPDDTALIYGLSGTDAASFTLHTSTGQLRTQAALNYETKPRYTVTVSVRDSKSYQDAADTATDDSITVTILVTNVNEAGTVAFAPSLPQEKQALTATLSDPDGSPSGVSWQWARSMDQNTWTPLSGETTNPYPLGASDVGQYLRATATYTDIHGAGQRVAAETGPVQAAPVVRLVLTPAAIPEQDGVSTVTATLDKASSADTVVTVTATAVAPATPQDFQPRGSTLTISAGATTSTGEVTVTAVDNAVDTPDKTVTLTGTTPNTLVTVPAGEYTLTLTDNDARGVMVSTDTLAIREEATDEYTVSLTSEPTETVTVTITGQAGEVSVAPDRLTFTPTTWDTPQPVTVTTGDDADAENDSATLTHTAVGGDYTGETATVAVTVNDGDKPATAVTLGVDLDEVAEGTSPTVRVTGTLDGAVRTGETVVQVSVTAETTQAADFAAVAAFPLTIPANAPAGTATFVLQAAEDATDEPAETVTVSGVVTGTSLTVTPATVTITDTDAPPTVELRLTPDTIGENGEVSEVRARLSHASSVATVVTLAAAPAGEYTLGSPPTLTIPAEATASTGAVRVTAVDNETDERDRLVPVMGEATNRNPEGVVGPAAVTVTITDDDPPEVRGDNTPKYVEHSTELGVATYTATNPAGGPVTWTVGGADQAQFAIDQHGGLRFAAPPDYEDRADTDGDNAYEVRVQASDGTLVGTLEVAVTVRDAPGVVTLSSLRPRVRNTLTAELRDPDGLPTMTRTAELGTAPWRWERSSDHNAWQARDGATTATYTPSADDVGYYLRATVTYTDGDGTPNKTAAVTTAAVVTPPPPRGGGGGGGGGAPACTQDDLHGNTAAQATDIALSAVTAGAICPAADVDYLTVTAPGQGLVFVDTTGSVNTRGTIWQAGETLASGPTDGSGPAARLGTRVQPGRVVIALQGQGGATGDYDVVVTFVQGYLENPGPDSFQSGVGVLSGWVCEAEVVEIELNGIPQEAAYGTERLDTAGVCGDTDNGFGLLFNWNLLGDGDHTVVAFVDGVELGRASVTVTTLGQEFLRNVTGTCEAEDFPVVGETVTLMWQQNSQNFVITEGSPPAGATTGRTSALTGVLENPGHNSFQSGVRVLSGWVCEADAVELEIGTAGRQGAAYGTERVDTEPACGDTDNGFGLLFNWNLLGDGEHEVVAYVDDVEFGRATVRVTTLGVEFLRGAEGECVVDDFPALGQTVTLEWQQNSQNFVMTAVE